VWQIKLTHVKIASRIVPYQFIFDRVQHNHQSSTTRPNSRNGEYLNLRIIEMRHITGNFVLSSHCLLKAKFHYTDTDTDTDFFAAKRTRTDPMEFRRKKSPCPCPCRARVRVRVVEFSYYLSTGSPIYNACPVSSFYYPRDVMLARVLAMTLCPSVCLSVSVCHKSEFYRNGWANRAGFWRGSFLPTILHCAKRKFGYLQK